MHILHYNNLEEMKIKESFLLSQKDIGKEEIMKYVPVYLTSFFANKNHWNIEIILKVDYNRMC